MAVTGLLIYEMSQLLHGYTVTQRCVSREVVPSFPENCNTSILNDYNDTLYYNTGYQLACIREVSKTFSQNNPCHISI